jgi:hypothetical protein
VNYHYPSLRESPILPGLGEIRFRISLLSRRGWVNGVYARKIEGFPRFPKAAAAAFCEKWYNKYQWRESHSTVFLFKQENGK